ncbi:Alpha/Beta hydrolase protein [Aspergillus bertholletiae]|uniref:Alpha/Beta hydrolase protein n=1 Tax=Aspergillus bertholletiae TaxID=1226010 RepID=A0A5N7BJJ7_9EURO|nr:Alpha/Beta hydrolase protein [Aspergillus bertholletiae]
MSIGFRRLIPATEDILSSVSRKSSSTLSASNSSHAIPTESPNTPSTIADPAQLDQTLILSDGRSLGFAEYGSPQGKPLLYFHGLPACRYEIDFQELGLRHGARIFALDRPGMGLSTFQPNRSLLDWPADVKEFTRQLGLDEYRVFGGSGGGPYSLVCAKALPKESLKGVGVLAGLAPLEAGTQGMSLRTRVLWNLGRWLSGLGRLYSDRVIVPATQHPDPAVLEALLAKTVKSHFNKTDSSIFDDEKILKHAAKVVRESFRQGSQGYVQECRILTKPWGFDLREIDFPGARLWCGDADRNTPVQMARWMANRIEGSVLTEWKGYSHFTFTDDHTEQVVRGMLET